MVLPNNFFDLNDDVNPISLNNKIEFDLLRLDRENPIADILRDLNVNSRYYDELGFFDFIVYNNSKEWCS